MTNNETRISDKRLADLLTAETMLVVTVEEFRSILTEIQALRSTGWSDEAVEAVARTFSPNMLNAPNNWAEAIKLARAALSAASSIAPATGFEVKAEVSREEIDQWLTEHCGNGIPHGEAEDQAAMLHGLAYVLRQIESTNSYRPHIGQFNSATSALRMALDHFATVAIRSSISPSVAKESGEQRG